MDDHELGQRIAYWRERRGITQKLLADRIGRSKSWIEKVEAGTRSANRLPILMAICRELRIDLPVLIGREPTRDTRECINDIQVEAIRSSLERYNAIRSQIPDEYSADISRLRSQVSYAWSAFELADYHVISRTLPDLLLDAQRCHVIMDSTDTERILAETYQIRPRRCGSWVSMNWPGWRDRGVALAERTGDPVLAALTGFRVAIALTSLGRADSAFNLNVSYAYRLEPGLRTEADRSVYGHILLQAAMAAASGGNAVGVRDMVNEARSVARCMSITRQTTTGWPLGRPTWGFIMSRRSWASAREG